jgi:hypothetical protein
VVGWLVNVVVVVFPLPDDCSRDFNSSLLVWPLLLSTSETPLSAGEGGNDPARADVSRVHRRDDDDGDGSSNKNTQSPKKKRKKRDVS